MRFFHTFVGSFYSDATYREVRKGPGNGLGYSFLLVALMSLVGVVVGMALLHRVLFTAYFSPVPIFDDAVNQIARQLPVMTLKDNRLVTKDAGPHTIVLNIKMGSESFDGPFAVIDTSSNAADYDHMTAPILITDKEVIVKDESKKETTINSFRELTDNKNPTIVVNRSMAEGMATQFISFMHEHLMQLYFVIGLFTWLMLVIVFYIMRLCLLVILALAGLLIAQCLRTKVTFDMSMRLAAVSYTPVMFIDLGMMLLGQRPPSAMSLILGGSIMLAAALYVTRDTPLAESA